MRGDVKNLFEDLVKNLELKTKLLNSLLENEKTASDLLKNRYDAEDDILKITDYESALIDEINAEDFHISQMRDEIIRKYRFDFTKIFKTEFNTTNSEILNYKKEIQIHEDILDKILFLKKQNIVQMEIGQNDLNQQVTELERIGKIKIVFPKDLRSS